MLLLLGIPPKLIFFSKRKPPRYIFKFNPSVAQSGFVDHFGVCLAPKLRGKHIEQSEQATSDCSVD